MKLKLSGKARKYLKAKRKLKVSTKVRTIEVADPTAGKATVVGKKKRKGGGKKG